jgi:hypothetical protein
MSKIPQRLKGVPRHILVLAPNTASKTMPQDLVEYLSNLGKREGYEIQVRGDLPDDLSEFEIDVYLTRKRDITPIVRLAGIHHWKIRHYNSNYFLSVPR